MVMNLQFFGGRGGVSGIVNKSTDSKYVQHMNDVKNGRYTKEDSMNLKVHDYNGYHILSRGSAPYSLYDRQLKQVILVTNTVKKMKSEIDIWENGLKERKRH